MSVVSEIISELTAWVTGFITLIIDIFTSFIKLFYDSTTGLTVFGSLALLGMGIGLVYLALNFVMRLFKR